MKACFIVIFAMSTVFFGAVTASACECSERRTPSKEFAASRHVVMLILDYVENDRASLTVVMNYKGDIGPGQRIFFVQSAGKDCRWRFGDEDIATLYIFYLQKRPQDGVLEASTCSRSAPVKDAFEDVKYINQIMNFKGLPLRQLKDDWLPTMDPRVGSLFVDRRSSIFDL